MSFIAEDLGVITPPVTRLRRELGYPGMVVLQFAFDPDDPRGPHRLENHGADVVAYTGTHDTDTLRGLVVDAGAARGATRRSARCARRGSPTTTSTGGSSACGCARRRRW